MDMQMSFFTDEELERLADEAVFSGVLDGGAPVGNTESEDAPAVDQPISSKADTVQGAVNQETAEVSEEKVSAPAVSKTESPKEKLVLAFAGQPTNGTVFPKEEKLVWKEYQRVIDGMVEGMSQQGGYRLLVPVWNKFDLAFLKSAERHGVPVTFVLPFESWGNTRLPKFQTDLVIRMKNRPENQIYVHSGKTFTERVHQAIAMADLIIGLEGSADIEQFYPTMNRAIANGKIVRPFPLNRMQYVTEEQAVAFEQSKVDNSALAQQNAEDVLQFG